MRRLLTLLVTLALFAGACSDGSAGDVAATATDPAPTANSEEATPQPAPEPTPTETAPEPTPTPESIFDAPGGLELPLPLQPAPPGTIIDTEPFELSSGTGQRILYHSTSTQGDDIAVSGFVAIPAGDPPADGWPLVSWAHGTVGLGDSCAPSAAAENDLLASALLTFGFAVVATDFEGLGTPGLHPYVVGPSEGHAVLDSVRAAQSLDLPVTDRWINFGHSQGGHAAMFTAQLQPSYAPELELIGTVAGAPPSQFDDLGESLIGGDFQGYLVMTAAGLVAAYPELELSDVLTDEAVALADVVESGCTAEIFEVFNPLPYDQVTRVDDPFALPDWSAALVANDTNQLPVQHPLLIIHGGEDEQIPVETSATLASQLCQFDDAGPLVRKVYPGQSHAGVLTNFVAVPDLLAWVNARFAGDPAPDECDGLGDQGTEGAANGSAPEPSAVIQALIDSETPLNIAHAGGDQQWPHSTLFAFGEAVAAGADVLELDVLLTADDVLIVQHDLTLDRTTETTGPVDDMTLAELDALDNAYWFSPQCWPCQDRPVDEYIYRGVRTGATPPPDGYEPDDFSIATLREVAERFPDLPLNIEIKGEGDQADDVARALAAELGELNRLDSSIVVSFDDDVIDLFHELAPTVAVSPGTNRLAAWLLTKTPLEPQFRIVQVPPFAQGLEIATAENIERAHTEGLTVWVWPNDGATQENEDFYIELLTRGADGIIAGRPLAMEAALNPR